MEIRKVGAAGITCLYSTSGGVTSLTVIKAGDENRVVEEKLSLEPFCDAFSKIARESCVQLSLAGDELLTAFAEGHSHKYAETSFALRLTEISEADSREAKTVTARFKADGGIEVSNAIKIHHKTGVAESHCAVKNNTGNRLLIDALPSVNISNLTPFSVKNDYTKLFLHNVLSDWSMEGRHKKTSLSELNLEDSWTTFGFKSERFGQVGSVPARKYYPFFALEDEENEAVWGIGVSSSGSWQAEVAAVNGQVSISAGAADYSFGHNRITVEVGGEYITPIAYVAVGSSVLEVQGLIRAHIASKIKILESERKMPVIYNEYCYTWGKPTFAKLQPIVDTASSLGIEYFVIDAGWYMNGGNWQILGDWEPSVECFPEGIKSMADYIRKKDMVPGVWFEPENVTKESKITNGKGGMLLTKAGRPIRNNGRMFLDFRKPEVRAHLRERVISFVKSNGFGYVKADYNANLGTGVDGEFSDGQNMQMHLDGVMDFYSELCQECAPLVLEICASGGHRNVYAFLKMCSMVSATDVHYTADIAYVAHNLARLIPSRQLLLWCTLNNGVSESDIYFYITGACLGRLCLSGGISELDQKLLEVVKAGIAHYRENAAFIEAAEIVGGEIFPSAYSYRKREGYMYTLKQKGGKAAVYVNGYGRQEIEIENEMFAGRKIISVYGGGSASLTNNKLRVIFTDELNGTIVYI